jgi:hypothetical protein
MTWVLVVANQATGPCFGANIPAAARLGHSVLRNLHLVVVHRLRYARSAGQVRQLQDVPAQRSGAVRPAVSRIMRQWQTATMAIGRQAVVIPGRTRAGNNKEFSDAGSTTSA